MNRERIPLLLAAGTIFTAAACGEKAMTYGDMNSVIAVSSLEIWNETSDEIYEAIEQTVLTVRDEKAFTVTYQEPYGEYWTNLRRFRQMLLIGALSDPWMNEAIELSGSEVDGPGVYRIGEVWSREQSVTLIVLPESRDTSMLPDHLAEVHAFLDRQFRAYSRNRMYFSGIDSALADTLAVQAGFSMILPDVYRWQTKDSVYLFRNDNPDPSELIRQITVTWRSPAPGTLPVDALLAWRAQLVEGYYTEPQAFVDQGTISGPRDFDGHEGYEIQSQWINPPDRGWPAGGPLIIRTVTCDAQDRTYLIDAWLYAPGKEKYEYMIQIETILDSFRCGS